MSYSVNVSKEVTLSIFNSIPKASAQREATENYEKVLKEEALSLAEEVKHRIEKASRSGNFSATVEINYSKCSAWSPIDLRCYMKSILMDLGYKVRFPDDRYCKLIIEW